MTSQARIDANRKNALLSRGATTAEGKERCRLNALKHGLRSEEVVLPTESRDAFNSLCAALMNDWKPPTETRRLLVEQLAVSFWRQKRCIRTEQARLADRIHEAEADWDRSFEDQINTAVRRFDDDHEESIAFLLEHARRRQCPDVDLE